MEPVSVREYRVAFPLGERDVERQNAHGAVRSHRGGHARQKLPAESRHRSGSASGEAGHSHHEPSATHGDSEAVMKLGNAGMICPRCGSIAAGFTDRVDPVMYPENQRDLGWSKKIRTYVHINGDECEMTVGPIFKPVVQSVPSKKG